MDALGESMFSDESLKQVPDLDWLSLSQEDKKNIPSECPVNAIPQLQEAWTHNDESSTRLVSNAQIAPMPKAKMASEDIIQGIVKYAKKEIMSGIIGKDLANKLASTYLPEDLDLAKTELIKLSSEQGLLGNVYIDLTPFESCHEAAKILGKNRVRSAKYVVGSPSRKVCASHHRGHCCEFNKKVVSSMEYNSEVLKEYTDHLRLAGVLGSADSIMNKDSLREAILRKPVKASIEDTTKVAKEIDKTKANEDFNKQLEKNAQELLKDKMIQRFYSARPILAHMQNQMLRGKSGSALKESIYEKFSSDDITKYTPEIMKVASLQGILGNIYVDVSYYKNPQEAIKAIKEASTNPLYIIHSFNSPDAGSNLAKVASATGCSELPRDGKLDKKVAFSYIKDLQIGNKIASEVSQELLNRAISGDCTLSLIKEAFDASLSYKKETRVAGVKVNQTVVEKKASINRETVSANIYKALEAGVSIENIESKVASLVGTSEAMSMVRKVVAGMDSISASCLSKCNTEKYDCKKTASIKPASKCASCVLKGASSCIKQSLNFVGTRDLDQAFFDIKEAKDESKDLDNSIKSVQLKDNPDNQREDMKQEYDMSDSFGSGMNITLNEMYEKKANYDIDLSTDGDINDII